MVFSALMVLHFDLHSLLHLNLQLQQAQQDWSEASTV